jgi:adenylate cyclase
VKATPPDNLSEIMARYYQRARSLVWRHGGVLDKFIGDAVLAIFNYPSKAPDTGRQAIAFATALVRLGLETTEQIKEVTNEVVETGTRIGITDGPIWPLNIGKDQIEVSFVGDVINLSARLEKECDVNGILISNTMRTMISRQNPGFVRGLNLQSRIIEQGRAKGQASDIRAWQLTPEFAAKLRRPA